MYGFLRPAKQYLSPESRKVYSQYYCGQCAALHDHFGYADRLLTSYDAAFIGLLIAAQQDEEPSMNRRRCALFPKKLDVCSSNNPSSQISSALAVYFCSMKIEDKKQDGNSSFLIFQERILNSSIKKAREFLSAFGIPSTLATDTLGSQQAIEQIRTGQIIKYTRPTERFLSELFRSTAKITHRPDNVDVLAQIGAALGRIIYLVDACVDLSDDIVKKEFNALMAAYAVGEELQRGTGNNVTGLIIQSLTEIRELLPRLELMRHREIIENILVVGLPLMIRREITRSLSRLKKYQPTILKHAPHMALASALCLFCTQNADAGNFSSGKDDFCGWPYFSDDCYDALFNPCVYYYPNNNNTGCTWFCDQVTGWPCAALTQAPKAVLSIGSIFYMPMGCTILFDKIRIWKKLNKEAKTKQRKEKARNDSLKRQKDNAEYINNLTKELKRYEKMIFDKVKALTLSSPTAGFSFQKKVQRLISEVTKVKQDILYSKDRKIADGIHKITVEAERLDKKLQAVCDSQAKLNKTIASIRESQKAKDKHIENELKFYKELMSISELKTLINDQRFENYHAIAEKILAEVSIIAGNNNG